MLAALSAMLAPVFGAAGGSTASAATPDTVTIDTGAITPTAGGGSMNLAGSAGTPWFLILAALALVMLWRRL